MHFCKAYTISRSTSIVWAVLFYLIGIIIIALAARGLFINERVLTILIALGFITLLPVSYLLGRRVAAQPHYIQLFEDRLVIEGKGSFTQHVAIGEANYNICKVAGLIECIEVIDVSASWKFYPAASIFYLNPDFTKLALALEKKDAQLIQSPNRALAAHLLQKPVMLKHSRRVEPMEIFFAILGESIEAIFERIGESI